MQLINTPNRYDKAGNLVLIEKRLHVEFGDSPFELPSETLSAELTALKPKHQPSKHHVTETI